MARARRLGFGFGGTPREYRSRGASAGRGGVGGTNAVSAAPSNLYDKAQAELESVKGLYQPGGAYDAAFEASKRKAADAALAQSVSAGMANVYNPQASGAAFEAEARPAWELGRTQGLAGAMTNAANLYAGRGSELYQGGLSRELGQLQSSTAFGTTVLGQAGATRRAMLGEQGATQRLNMQLNAENGTNRDYRNIFSPFQSMRS